MSENRKTAMFGGVTLALLLVTWVTTPRVRTPSVFAERGEVLFPQFRDPNAAASLEVVEFDPRTATVKPFKVQNRNGRWTIPSQHDYPVDAKDRLAQTAAALIALKKDDFATDNAADYDKCGVLDPLDTTLPALNGRGTRLTVRGANENVLADVIVGNPVQGHAGFRYIRQAGQRRVYTSAVGNLKVSTAFGDWIERDLLQVDTVEIDAINLRNYALDRTAGKINPGETLLLAKDKNGDWTINSLKPGEELNLEGVDALLRNLAGLRIVGVLPKPPGITASISRVVGTVAIANLERADLARKGFYLVPSGQLVSDRGEVVVRTERGVFYTLRFGDVAPDTDAPAAEPVAADGSQRVDGGSAADAPKRAPAARENRYLFIMVDFDAASAATPGRAQEGMEKANLLRARFAPWYYVIAADSFGKIRAQRSDLVKVKKR